MQPHQFDTNFGEANAKENITVSDLSVTRLEELETFAIALDNPVLRQQLEDDDTFTMIIQLSLDDYGVAQNFLAEVLQTQSSTIGRWKQGRNVPSIYSRSGIISAIASIITDKIANRSKK